MIIRLFDNKKDPYQLHNLIGEDGYDELENSFNSLLNQKLKESHDQFFPGKEYTKKWGYQLDENETVPYAN